MAARIVVVGASAGGVQALVSLAKGLPADLQAPVVVVLHVPAAVPSALPAILARSGPLDARHARDGEALEPGTIYVAPPDLHLLVAEGTASLVRGPRESGHRPAIDPLFRSAAREFGPGTIAVVLSGSRDDGAAGVAAVAARGGHVLVQDPADAVLAAMPANAIAADNPEYVVPAAEIAPIVARLAAEPLPERPTGDAEEREESDAAFAGSENVERAVWAALRALEERVELAERVARRLRDRELGHRAERYERQALESKAHANVLREVLLGSNGDDTGD